MRQAPAQSGTLHPAGTVSDTEFRRRLTETRPQDALASQAPEC